jgi:hypothetical protein
VVLCSDTRGKCSSGKTIPRHDTGIAENALVNLKTAVALGLTVGPVAGLVAIEGGVVSGVIKESREPASKKPREKQAFKDRGIVPAKPRAPKPTADLKRDLDQANARIEELKEVLRARTVG